MKGKVKFAAIAVLLTVFVAAFAEEAPAAAKPSWVGTTWSAKLVKNPNVKDVKMNSADYWVVQIAVSHKNNSKDRDITAFYDKTLTFSAKVTKNNFQYPSITVQQSHGAAVKSTTTSNRVNNVEVWPGRSYSLGYYIGIKSLITPGDNWQFLNQEIAKFNGDINKLFTDRRLSYDCHVRSRAVR